MTDLRFPLSQRILARLDHEHAETLDAMRVLAGLSGIAANYSPDNDGYGHGVGDGGPRGTSALTSVEAAASARIAGATEAEMERIVEGAFAGYEQLLAAASRLSAYVTPRERKQGRQNTAEQCPVCNDVVPRLKAGFCPTDHRQWCREGRPDRAWFVRRRRAEIAKQRDAEAQAARAAKAGRSA